MIRTILTITITFFFLSASSAFAEEPLPQPEFTKINFLGVDGIKEMNINRALVYTDSIAALFLNPFDALILHVEFDGDIKDVFIISDDAMCRLMIWVTKLVGNNKRVVEAIKEYKAEDSGLLLDYPRGMDTNAKNRLFDPTKDVIYLADTENDRVLELAYIPDPEGGKIVFNRAIGENELRKPTDVAISAYGDASQNSADLYISELGTNNYDGGFSRYNIDGVREGFWSKINFYNSQQLAVELRTPLSIACFPDTTEGMSLIYISDRFDNALHCLLSKSDSEPFFFNSINMIAEGPTGHAEGIALDDYGRVYVANVITGQFEILEREMWQQFEPFGNNVIQPDVFYHPHNIILDTYYQQCEALVLEGYDRESGIQTYIVEGGYSPEKPKLGFMGSGLLKPSLQRLASLPSYVNLHDAYPNPFNAQCVIAYDLPEQSKVSIEVFNVLGQKVATLIDKLQAAGSHQVVFDGSDLASGIYLYKINAGGQIDVKKAVLLK